MKTILDYINRHKYILLLLLIIAVSAICQLYQINRDLNGLHEYIPALNIVKIRNLLEYGPLKTKFGPAVNINPLNGKFMYYLYHPFFDTYFHAPFFKIFGPSILTGRLASMFFFAFGTFCLYFLVAHLWSKKIALWASFFYAFFPISQYHSKWIASDVVMLFMFLFILFYYLWQRDNKPFHFFAMIISFILGCLTGWYTYFLAPIAIIHYRYILKKQDNKILTLICIAGFLVIAYLTFNYFLTGSFLAAQSLWPASIQNSISAGYNQNLIQHLISDRLKFNLLLQNSYYSTIISHLILSFTFPIIALVLYFLFNYREFKYLKTPMVYVFFIAFTYLNYGLLNPKTLSDHIGLCVFLSAAFATICALIISKQRRLWQITFVIIFLIFSFFNIRCLYTLNNTNQDNLMLGKIIPLISEPDDGIALSKPFFSPFIEYYGHRKILYDVTNWKKLNYMINSDKIKYFVTNFNSFQRYLLQNYSAVFLPNNYIAFDLSTKNMSKSNKKHDIFFSNNVHLIDYSFKRLPKDYLFLEYSWKKSRKAVTKFKVFVHFEDENKKYLFGQDHFILNGFTDMTKQGRKVIKERYLIKIPNYALDKKFSVYIGLYSPLTGKRVDVKNISTYDNRVLLGEIAENMIN